MARTHYAGHTTLFGERYKNVRVGRVERKDGVCRCPKCNSSDKLSFVWEYEQMGFDGWNKYFDLNICEDCGYKFCIVMVRKDVVYGI